MAVLLFSGMATGSHYYDHDQGLEFDASSGFSVPEYDSQAEIATELVAPFIFLTVILRFGFQKVLIFTFASEENGRHPMDVFSDKRMSFSKEATLMALTVTAMLIPTPFWTYVRLIASSLGLIATSIIALTLLYLIFSFLKG
ncbi:MAG: hypothetical protein ABEJ02_02165 [Candidatus Paceibacteria bacterium]